MENIKQEVMKALKGLHNNDFLRCNVDEQCQSRFKMSWQEVKDAMRANLIAGYEVMPGLPIKTSHLVEGLMINTTGNWMTNQYLDVIYLSIIRSYDDAEYHLNEFAKGNDGCHIYPRQIRLLIVAPLVCPDIVAEILSSHNIHVIDERVNKRGGRSW